jgi:hypothetical protein
MKNNECIKQLIKLSEENPDLEIIAKVDSDCVVDDSAGYGWWGASIGESEIEDYWLSDEQYLFEEDIRDHLYIKHEIDKKNLSCFDANVLIATKYEELKNSGKIKKAIFVNIQP